MATFISVDWDFFPAVPDEYGHTQLPGGGSISNYALYDWGQGEGATFDALAGYLWHSRAGQFRALGLDLTKHFGIREDLGSTDPSAFTEEMRRLGGGDLGPTAWAPSHAWAFHHLSNLVQQEGPLDVLHFDAHHDLGYKEGQVERMRNFSSGKLDCGVWLLAAVEFGLASSVHVIYPEWRGLDEWESSQGLEWMPGAATAQAWTWDRYLARFGEETTDVVGTFVARSDGWTPPYLDPAFEQLVHGLAGERTPFGMHPGVDFRREWSEEWVQHETDERLRLLRQHPELRGDNVQVGEVDESAGAAA